MASATTVQATISAIRPRFRGASGPRSSGVVGGGLVSIAVIVDSDPLTDEGVTSALTTPSSSDPGHQASISGVRAMRRLEMVESRRELTQSSGTPHAFVGDLTPG